LDNDLYAYVCLQSVVSTVTRRSGVLTMCVAATIVNDVKLPNSVVGVVTSLHVCIMYYKLMYDVLIRYAAQRISWKTEKP